ncbi:uncharacterized protein MELLADRAFT_112623 [Melampsora larici-populina 98AG31]|uniref:Uncharacterized protein n=1 Tax=Melampsora larici-populina (strain 98AG31 / pathotype 3-4-7) TaxID=747676 RepID=F4S727_MELLP|nr:uncharacterized protein MELLADRAFT_112623 [Melampsora larici-populina 98AG31]EGF99566.1 hypothetical protein MELLADRAFT_112623 [Melampsora larici-populina 98AG31]
MKRSHLSLKQPKNVSSSIARDYDIIYRHPPGECPEESAIQAAAQLVSKQQKTNVMLSNITEEVEEEILANSVMSLFNLLNPVNQSSDEQHPSQSVEIQANEQPTKALVYNDQHGAHLANTCLLDIRATNDSQVKKHQGNERARGDVNQLRNTRGGKMNPSECSKLVAVVMKSTEVTPTGVSRIHQWNITVKLDLSKHVQNTTSSLDLPTNAIITGGGISKNNPLEHGKFVVIIKNNVSTPYRPSVQTL